MTDENLTPKVFHRQHRGGLSIYSCCPIGLCKAIKSIGDGCVNQVLKGVTGLNKVERTLTGISLWDLLFYRPSYPSHNLPGSVIKRVEGLMKNELEKSSLFREGSMTSDDIEIESQELAKFVNLQPGFIPTLTIALEQMRKASLARSSIIELQKTPFDSNNSVHIQVGIIESTTEQNSNNGSHSWSELGFQSEPSRDFRGAGYLGALNLLWFAEKHRLRARRVLNEANSTESHLWFPFAATGLNVTVWLINLMESGYLDVFFYNNTNSPIDTFNLIYSFVFLEFSRFWHLSRPINIMQFGQVSRQFLTKVEAALSEMSDPSFHSEWSIPMTSTGTELTEELRCWIDGEVPLHRMPTTGGQRVGEQQPSSASQLVTKLSALP